METVILKNGTEEAKPLVVVTMLSLTDLIDRDPMAFYDLVMLCRNPDYAAFGNAQKRLMDLKLVQHDGRVHDSIRNIVISATCGDGVDMTLGSPYKEK